METAEARSLMEALQQLDDKHGVVFMRTLSLLLACSRDNEDFGAVIVLRIPAENDMWALHVQSLNLDIDDAYLALLNSASQIGEQIQKEAPPHAHLN